ncbi:MAG: Trm112 family protein [Paracoccus sp. (in: a-proteobacteria)]|nr:Trm112 family protein [Paracoccus sp. (in: a-proteobacteria)]
MSDENTPEPDLAGADPGPGFDRHMLEALVCPVTHGALRYDAARGELISKQAGLAFPIRAGIPIMLVSEARQID